MVVLLFESYDVWSLVDGDHLCRSEERKGDEEMGKKTTSYEIVSRKQIVNYLKLKKLVEEICRERRTNGK